MTIFINPGSGPVSDTTEENAKQNLERFADDLRANGHDEVRVGPITSEDEGRYSAIVYVDGRRCEVDMPGLPLEQVRFMDESDQNIWHFPRLYVDGSSWVWCFALGVCGPDEDDA